MIYVAWPLMKLQSLQFIRDSTRERNHINIIFVAEPLVKLQTLLFIGEFILERNHVIVVYVPRLSV